MERKKLRCYIYLRVSTAMQVEGYSLDAQRERVTRYADFQGIEIVREYCDAGKSGKSISGRPEFTQMLQDIADGRDDVDYVLVFKLSRFGRNAADVLNSLQYIQDFGVNLICVEDGIDSSKDSGKLTITVLSAVAEIERENILVQTMEGRKQKAREGKWNGGQAPFGYRVDARTSTLVVEPEEAEIVKIIYDKFAYGDMGLEGVANYLNQHGYTKNKYRETELNYFTKGLIKNILDNPVYIGKITYGRSVSEKVKGTRDQYRRVKADDYLVVDGKHEPLIDEKLWCEVRAKRRETGVAWVKSYNLEHEHILSGILKCPVCGAGMAGTLNRKRRKKTGDVVDTFFYRCKHRKKIDDEHFCNFQYALNEDEINREVENVILDMVNNEKFREFVIAKMEEKVDVSSMEEERGQFKRQLTQVSGSKDKLVKQLESLDARDKHYERKYQDMQERLDILYDKINDLEAEIDDINEKIIAVKARNITCHDVLRILSDFDKLYYNMTDAEKKEFFQNFIEKIELYPEKDEYGNIIRKLYFKFAVYYNGEGDKDGVVPNYIDSESGKIDSIEIQKGLPSENTVETVVQLSKGEINSKKVRVEFSLENMDMSGFQKGSRGPGDLGFEPTGAERRPTYGQIKEYVKEHSGLSVSSLYIAQVKQKYGIIERECYNKPKSENARQSQCPPEKEAAITEALRWFKMIE